MENQNNLAFLFRREKAIKNLIKGKEHFHRRCVGKAVKFFIKESPVSKYEVIRNLKINLISLHLIIRGDFGNDFENIYLKDFCKTLNITQKEFKKKVKAIKEEKNSKAINKILLAKQINI